MPYSTLVGGAVGGNPDVPLFLKGVIRLSNANEAGWKDTILTPPGMVTRLVVPGQPHGSHPTGNCSPSNSIPFDDQRRLKVIN